MQGRLLLALAAYAAVAAMSCSGARAEGKNTMVLEARIPLGDVRGRIDHLAADLTRGLLFVAELENNSLGVVDISARRVRHRITNLSSPQGVAYLPQLDIVLSANGGDGSVRFFSAGDYSETGRVDLGNDADNIRVDVRSGLVVVGYGDGALVVVDPASRRKIADIPLDAHPEGFQLDAGSKRAFVNIPKSQQIAVVDLGIGNQVSVWPLADRGNFPMAIEGGAARVFVGFRDPPAIGVYSTLDGKLLHKMDACGDVDDLHVDTKRRRLYASCGEGFVDVFSVSSGDYLRADRIPSAVGARTSLFIPELDRLFIAARATTEEPAAILVFRPSD